MYRAAAPSFIPVRESPHRRGDVPIENMELSKEEAISPQAWGCTGEKGVCSVEFDNLPTGVGMYRKPPNTPPPLRESPHRRGDVPSGWTSKSMPFQISPQAWGCTEPMATDQRKIANLPTGVGMYRPAGWAGLGWSQSPHRRGDVPGLYRPSGPTE